MCKNYDTSFFSISLLRCSILLFIVCFSLTISGQEICNNGIDDDGDGKVDLNDSECLSVGCDTVFQSLIPNHSFEERNDCPTTFSTTFSFLHYANGWSQATNGTADFLHTCNYISPAAKTVGLLPADGNGMVGIIIEDGYKEFVGRCLQRDMLAGETYTIEFNLASLPITSGAGLCNGGSITYTALDFTLYGVPGCATFPLNTSNCISGWSVLGAATYTPTNSWSTITITVTPTVDIGSVIIGGPCALPASYANQGFCKPYFYVDGLTLLKDTFFIPIDQTGRWCENDVQLNAASTFPGVTTYQWYKDGIALVGETGVGLQVSTNSYGPGEYTVTYENGVLCGLSTDSVVIPNPPVSDFSYVNTCFGSPTFFTDYSVAKEPLTNIVSWEWDFDNDGSTDAVDKNPQYVFTTAGTYTTKLTVTDENGCSHISTAVVTVDSDVDACGCLGFSPTSLVPNSSFENKSCCPDDRNQMTCVDNWNKPSWQATDYFNTCDYANPITYPKPNAPISGGSGYLGFMDGTKIEGLRKSYIGNCLTTTMVAGTEYTMKVNLAHANGDKTFNLVLYGATSCASLPFTGFSCPPVANWFPIATTTVNLSTTGTWEQTVISFTPSQNISAVVIGGDCNSNVPGGGVAGANFYYLDDFTIAEKTAFTFTNIVESGDACSNNLALQATSTETGVTWQWYKNGVALNGETSANLDISGGGYGSGNFTVKQSKGLYCDTLSYTIAGSSSLSSTITKGTSNCLGCGCKEWVMVNATSGTAPFTYSWPNGYAGRYKNKMCPGSYDIVVTDSTGCSEVVSVNVP